ncbi:hypothetical protein LUZ60_002979 [Juncus effusus]|nr:hypothetical protein LUZ60_002979 [Juncus effusus]
MADSLNASTSSSPPLTSAQLSTLLLSLSHSLSLSQTFLSSRSLSLSPSLALPLDSALRSASLSFSRLLSLLPLPLQTLCLQSILSVPPPLQFPSSWFLQLLSDDSSASPPSFRVFFRVSKPTFFLLLRTLQLPHSSIPPEHKLGVTLFRLAHSAQFSAITRRFGLSSPSLACRAFYEVCHEITTKLNHLIAFNSDNISMVTQGFHHLSLPNCCGVIGYTRFPIKKESSSNSTIAQALVDSNGRFMDLSVGWHGSMIPIQILRRTSLFKSGLIVPPRYVLGDSSCPLLPWLITPYRKDPNSDLVSSQLVFNEVHNQGMEIVNKAFRMVKDRWRLLIGGWKETQAHALPYIVVTSCLLHNFLISCGEPLPEAEKMVPIEMGFGEFEGEGDEGGERMRDALASHLFNVRSHSHFG